MKTISFDLWNTLIQSNPAFLKARVDMIKHVTTLSEKEIERTYKMFKSDIDSTFEKFGMQFTLNELYTMLHTQLQIDNDKMSVDTFMRLYTTTFFDNMPTLKDSVKEVLQYCKDNGYKMCIASNTVLIPPAMLRGVLSTYSIYDYFDFMIFSADISCSKPNPNFFAQIHIQSKCLKRNIIHVGDSRVTDIDGALNYGFKTIVVKDDLSTLPARIEFLFNNKHEQALIELNIFN
ncbi:MAG: HAD family hydrolase [Spirochaetes bacterium]|nr:MAG: HAD family hydrolase [Spirochaetota bacterium]